MALPILIPLPAKLIVWCLGDKQALKKVPSSHPGELDFLPGKKFSFSRRLPTKFKEKSELRLAQGKENLRAAHLKGYPGFQRIFFSDRYFAAKPR